MEQKFTCGSSFRATGVEGPFPDASDRASISRARAFTDTAGGGVSRRCASDVIAPPRGVTSHGEPVDRCTCGGDQLLMNGIRRNFGHKSDTKKLFA